MIQTQKVTIPTSYFPKVGRIYPNAFIEGINQYYVLGDGWTIEWMECTQVNLEALKQKGVASVNLKITRATRIQLALFTNEDIELKKTINADFKLSELI